MRIGDYPAAIDKYGGILVKDPSDSRAAEGYRKAKAARARELVMEAQRALEVRDFDGARRHFRAAAELDLSTLAAEMAAMNRFGSLEAYRQHEQRMLVTRGVSREALRWTPSFDSAGLETAARFGEKVIAELKRIASDASQRVRKKIVDTARNAAFRQIPYGRLIQREERLYREMEGDRSWDVTRILGAVRNTLSCLGMGTRCREAESVNPVPDDMEQKEKERWKRWLGLKEAK
jgi:hypothetical protein